MAKSSLEARMEAVRSGFALATTTSYAKGISVAAVLGIQKMRDMQEMLQDVINASGADDDNEDRPYYVDEAINMYRILSGMINEMGGDKNAMEKNRN